MIRPVAGNSKNISPVRCACTADSGAADPTSAAHTGGRRPPRWIHWPICVGVSASRSPSENSPARDTESAGDHHLDEEVRDDGRQADGKQPAPERDELAGRCITRAEARQVGRDYVTATSVVAAPASLPRMIAAPPSGLRERDRHADFNDNREHGNERDAREFQLADQIRHARAVDRVEQWQECHQPHEAVARASPNRCAT